MTEMKMKGTEAPAKTKKLKPSVVSAIIIAVCAVVTAGVFLLIWFLGSGYQQFDRYFSAEVAIPGLEDGLTPRGVATSGDRMLICGNMSGEDPSRVYYVNDGESVGYTTFALSDGTAFTGEANGIATNGSKVWIASEGMIYIANFSDVIKAAESNGSTTFVSKWDANCRADFCYCDGSYLYVGEYYHEGSSETSKKHTFDTPSGEKQYAAIFRYGISNYSESSKVTPSRAYSITGDIRGMAILDNGKRIVLSQSYGNGDSKLLVYEPDNNNYSYSAFSVNGTSLRTYWLDSNALVDEYLLPPMSEGMCNDGNKVFLAFSSGSKSATGWVNKRITDIYSIRIRK